MQEAIHLLVIECFGCPLVAYQMAARVREHARLLRSCADLKNKLRQPGPWKAAMRDFKMVVVGRTGARQTGIEDDHGHDHHHQHVAQVYHLSVNALLSRLEENNMSKCAEAVRLFLRVLRLFPPAREIPEGAIREAWQAAARPKGIHASLFDKVRYRLECAAVIEAWTAPVLFQEQGAATVHGVLFCSARSLFNITMGTHLACRAPVLKPRLPPLSHPKQ
jgi:hypothetical protein